MAAQQSQQQAQKINCNFVAQDEIWKSHIKQEVVAAKKWPQNWGFLTTRYEDLVKDDMPPREPRSLPPAPVLAAASPTPIGHHIRVDPSPKPIPETSNKMIGWRSSVDSLRLERYGRYAKPKGSILKSFDWPAEAAV
ncbi:hypothetical protein CAPTEDRAFT_156825 [Capitella teleta]|uniref:Uncharacterized protein n=1 Tax=Capitella teleta TaxID=283909 RepID=R7TNR0_CAPTE|nr:hypothetical protein CAPTEDRAFT_156825 [Capitella teleta]|eukprot:ELT93176.1 hypothetical protein CAPTEDRAFT_156825 [Capitella teleta]